MYSEVLNDGQKYVSTKWVLTVKFINGKKKTKAPLVARGFEEGHFDINYNKQFLGNEFLE